MQTPAADRANLDQVVPRRRPEHAHGAPTWEARPLDDREPAWHFDPTALSLEASAWRDKTDLARPFCAEVGRRLLLGQLQSSEWILRRVEKVDMSEREAVRRSITLELLVPADAPVFVDTDGRQLRCVPLSLMRRRTLVGLDIRDESGEAVTMPGIRVTQQLDQAMLLAAAAAACADADGAGADDAPRVSDAVVDWIRRSVSGDRQKVVAAYAELAHPTDQTLRELTESPLFMNVADRLRHNFTLCVFLDESAGRHRLIQICFEEPTDWRYQKPSLVPVEDVDEPPAGACRGDRHYAVGLPSLSKRGALARLGLVPQRIRFQVPGAEYAASYHFELAAPPGVRIVRATLLAGRPNNPRRHVSLDDVRGHTPTVGLHAVEVPNGSLCRVQADLCLPARGYLGTMLVANIAMVLLMGVVATHARRDSFLSVDEVTNVILFLVTAVAAAAALVAQGDLGGLAARFVSAVRVLTTIALALPVVAAVLLTFDGTAESFTSVAHVFWTLWGLFLASIALCVLTLWAFLSSWIRERSQVIVESPWDMTTFQNRRGPWWLRLWRRLRGRAARTAPRELVDFNEELDNYHFDSSAIGVASAEGWHSVYAWDDDKQIAAVDALEAHRFLPGAPRQGPACHLEQSTCARRTDRCPSLSTAQISRAHPPEGDVMKPHDPCQGDAIDPGQDGSLSADEEDDLRRDRKRRAQPPMALAPDHGGRIGGNDELPDPADLVDGRHRGHRDGDGDGD